MRDRDHRYDIVQAFFLKGDIRYFGDIFKYIPKTVVALDLGMRLSVLDEMTVFPGRLTVERCILLADLIGVERMAFYEVLMRDVAQMMESLPLRDSLRRRRQ